MSNTKKSKLLRTKPNYLYSIISVALVLFLLGLFGFVILFGQQLIVTFKEQVNILVEVKPNAAEEEVLELQERIKESVFAKPNSVQYFSEKEGAEFMQKDFDTDILKLDLTNPLYALITFNVKSDYMSTDSLEGIRNGLRDWDAVNDVYYQENIIDQLINNMERIGYITLGIGLFLIIVAVTLIHNTIRLALYSNRFLVKNMELVGASWEFITRPYLIKAFQHGLISGILAVGGLYVLIYWVRSDIPEVNNAEYLPSTLGLFGLLIILGILINTLSTYYVVNKYLRMRVNDLY